jgi:hypothetical protein
MIQIPAGTQILVFTAASKPALGSTHPPDGFGGNIPRDKAVRSMNLTTHLLLGPRLRILGAIPPFPDASSWSSA